MALPPFLAFLDQNDPEFAQAIDSVATTAMKPGALDAKTKLLIALALDAAHGATEGVQTIADVLRGMGPSNEEIVKRPAAKRAFLIKRLPFILAYQNESIRR